jgi:two-component system LytT family response regulator
VRALIVDDEPLAREKIRMMLSQDRDVEVIGECANGEQAVEVIQRESPDLVFLDVQMPGLDGFGVLQRVGIDRVPGVVFVTAFDQHALKAFDVHAVDYLLKPFARKRFNEALVRVKEHLSRRPSGEINRQILSLLDELQGRKKFLERIAVKSLGRVVFLKVEDIEWIEAAGNYVNLHVGSHAHLLRETMNGIETQLDPGKYARIHRSTIVNIERIKELSPLFHGDYSVTLTNGTRLTLSRSYRERLNGLLSNTL